MFQPSALGHVSVKWIFAREVPNGTAMRLETGKKARAMRGSSNLPYNSKTKIRRTKWIPESDSSSKNANDKNKRTF